jgi:nitrate/nitrite transport system permease protein
MLAQNSGQGKFVWDEFQNGSSDSMGRIMVAVLTIGFIGFLLDKLMLALQKKVSWDKHREWVESLCLWQRWHETQACRSVCHRS